VHARILRRGFTLVELLIVIAIIALLIGILLPGLGQARKTARRVICTANLQQYGTAHIAYAADYKEKIAAYNWRAGVRYLEADPDIQIAGRDVEAGMNQAVHILRRRGDRGDIERLLGRAPHRRYSHLILNDYLQHRLPEPTMACPEDRVLLNWQRSPHALDPMPLRSSASPVWLKLWAYSSSYQLVPAAWSPDQRSGRINAIVQSTTDHNLMNFPSDAPLGGRGYWEIAFPANKVGVFAFHDMHSATFGIYHAYEQAIAPAMFWDGSVRFERTGDGNNGFQPRNPTSPAPTKYQYRPGLYGFEPPTLSGPLYDTVDGQYRWTRGGLKGVDFGASEINTGQIR
jgi:prepilin-type N-terminal cleavage/methylation domain-containing protein